MRVRRAVVARVAVVVTGAATFIAVPGVTGWCADVGRGIKHHPLPVVLGLVTIVLLLYLFGDELLRLVHIQTPSSSFRLIRKWLDSQRFTVTVQQSPPAFVCEAKGQADQVLFTIKWRDAHPRGVTISAAAGLGDRDLAVDSATPRELRALKLELAKAAALVSGTLSVVVGDPTQPRKPFFSATSLIFPSDLTPKSFFVAIHDVRRSVMLSIVLVEAALLDFQESVSLPLALRDSQTEEGAST